MKKIRIGITIVIFLLLISLCQSQVAFAQTVSELDDPEYWKARGDVSNEFYPNINEVLDNSIVPYSFRENYSLKFGVDVSKYQGTINWKSAKEQGVEFAIIRVGYRGLNSGSLNEDPNYVQNIKGALAQGIHVGVYFFSQAITETEAIEEANYIISRIYKFNITLPIVIDFEYASDSKGNSGRLYNANLSKEQATTVCKAFCQTVQKAGYTGMVYANKSMLTSNLNAIEIAKDYRIWLAHYTSETNYNGIYDFWQYTSRGNGYAYGMGSQYVDLNYWYDDGTICGKDYAAVFDAEYYANKYHDIEGAYGNETAALLAHFINFGMNEGRQGIATFNVQSYKNAYKDLRGGYGNDTKGYYLHYIDYGKNEGRVGTGYENVIVDGETIYKGVDYSSVYNVNDYLKYNPDLLSGYGYDEDELLVHFVNYGMSEGRQASSLFNVQSYKNRYKDLREGYGNDLEGLYLHYINYGRKEGRLGTGCETTIIDGETLYNGIDYSSVYNVNEYIRYNPDLLEGYGYNDRLLLMHFVKFGMDEGRQGAAEFNVQSYKNRYRDLRNGYGNNSRAYYMHYITYGKREGRIGNGCEVKIIDGETIYNGIDYSSVYNTNDYLNYNSDLLTGYGYNDMALLAHFVNYGMAEGRQASCEFNVYTYRQRYSDLRKGYGNNLKDYYLHYMNYGKNEGRKGA